jgi:CheY-like chemotaxis protein
MADIFEDLGYQVDVAYDGPSAITLVEKHRYDVALLDLMMPGLDGAEVYDEIKKRCAGTVAIIATAYPGHPRTSTALTHGVWKLLPKPVDLANLLQVIDEAISQPLLLIVDDEQDFCDNLWDLLRERGYRPCIAHDVTTANRLVREDDGYKLVLLDLKLPDGDVGVILQAARGKCPHVPIVLVTANRAEFEPRILELLAEGARVVLAKPLDVSELMRIVSQLASDY